MRDKVLQLADRPGCVGIRVERQEGSRYVMVNEVTAKAASAAWNLATEDGAIAGGLYKFTAVDATGAALASHRWQAPAPETFTPEQAMVARFDQQNRQLMSMLESMVNTAVTAVTAMPQIQNLRQAETGSQVGAVFGQVVAHILGGGPMPSVDGEQPQQPEQQALPPPAEPQMLEEPTGEQRALPVPEDVVAPIATTGKVGSRRRRRKA